ncbi:MAG: VWA domain-containing protein [Bryobacteraceae bacterium]
MHKALVLLGVPSIFICGMWMVVRPSSAQQAADSSTIRTSVEEVVLDLSVRDNRGKQLKNLEQSDVTVLEDGVPQKIKSFRLVSGREARQEETAASPSGTPATAAASPLPAVNLICLVFQNLDPFNKKYATEAAQEFVKNQMVPNTWIAAFTLNSRLTPLHDFTTNRELIFQIVNNVFTNQSVDFMNVADEVLTASPNITSIQTAVIGNPAAGGTVQSTLVTTGGEVASTAINGADVNTGQGANRLRGDAVDARREFGNIEGRRSMDAIETMIAQLKTLPGRKSILLLSPGLPTNGDPDQFSSIVKKANQADVTFYAVDINGLAQNSNLLAGSNALSHAAGVSASQAGSTGSAAANMEKMRESDYVDDAVRNTDTRATLRALAEGTGGFLIADTNDLRKSYQRVLDDVAAHYEVIYSSSNTKHDGSLRTIEVKTSRRDITIESRTGYYAMPVLNGDSPLKPYEMMDLAALNVKTPPHAFDFRTSAFEFRPKGADRQDVLAIAVPASSVSATPDPATKTHKISVSLLSLIKDSTGEVVDKFSRDTALTIPDDKLSLIQGNTIPYSHDINLPAGHYTVETAVVDMETKRASKRVFAFDAPEKKGVAVSSVVLVERLENVAGKPDPSDPFVIGIDKPKPRRVIPELDSSLRAGAHPYVYFVVYPDKTSTEKPKLQVEFLVDGKVLAKQIADLPAPDSSGSIPMLVATAAQPGKCQLRISALQGSATAVQSVDYSVAAN